MKKLKKVFLPQECGKPGSDTFPPSCTCYDGSAWSLPPGPCEINIVNSHNYDSTSFTCSGNGTVSFDKRCPKGEKRTGGACNDLSTFDFYQPTPPPTTRTELRSPTPTPYYQFGGGRGSRGGPGGRGTRRGRAK